MQEHQNLVVAKHVPFKQKRRDYYGDGDDEKYAYGFICLEYE